MNIKELIFISLILSCSPVYSESFSDFLAGGHEKKVRLDSLLDMGAHLAVTSMKKLNCSENKPFSSDCDKFVTYERALSSSRNIRNNPEAWGLYRKVGRVIRLRRASK